MITVSCVGYFLEFVGRLRIKSSENVHFGLIFPFLEHCEVVEKFYLSTYKPLFNLAYWNLTWKRLVCFLEMTVYSSHMQRKYFKKYFKNSRENTIWFHKFFCFNLLFIFSWKHVGTEHLSLYSATFQASIKPYARVSK